ncbi:helix-turn-helix transcriptional regulator [Pelomonas sp. KK5]|uniref:helix-turn-helix transcriptional regulator n=1 Tax=Pelomonas sp. KK5 TaxID=1855730 RepID=UPI00117E7C14|nr:helix-turn-helix transcriptional regulator [Pelomonas sp. KK5]
MTMNVIHAADTLMAESLQPADLLDATLAAAALDEVDYPMLVVDAELHLRHANRLGDALLRTGRPLRLTAGRSVAGADDAADARLLHAVGAAVFRGLRTLLPPEPGSPSGAVSVVPLGGARAMLMLAKPGLCQDLTLSFYARIQRLTTVETAVLSGLCAGHSPEAIAQGRGVALSTVRTHISSLRAKTGMSDIGALLHTMARLPPVVKVAVA